MSSFKGYEASHTVELQSHVHTQTCKHTHKCITSWVLMPLFLGYLCSKGPNASLALIQLGFTARGLVELIPLLWCCIICNSVSVCVWDSAVVLRIQTLGKHTQSVTYKQIINQLWRDARSVIYLWGTCLESNVIQHHGYAENPVFVLGQPICGEPGSEVSLQMSFTTAGRILDISLGAFIFTFS